MKNVDYDAMKTALLATSDWLYDDGEYAETRVSVRSYLCLPLLV